MGVADNQKDLSAALFTFVVAGKKVVCFLLARISGAQV